MNRLPIRLLPLAAAVLALAALAGPWWVVTVHGGTYGTEVSSNVFTFFGSTFTWPNGVDTRTISYSAAPGFASVVTFSLYLLVVGIGAAVLATVTALVPTLRRPSWLPTVLCAASFAATLGSVVNLMTAAPGAANANLQALDLPSALTIASFWGTQPANTPPHNFPGPITWGAGWAWYLALVASVLALLSAVLLWMFREPRAGTPDRP